MSAEYIGLITYEKDGKYTLRAAFARCVYDRSGGHLEHTILDKDTLSKVVSASTAEGQKKRKYFSKERGISVERISEALKDVAFTEVQAGIGNVSLNKFPTIEVMLQRISALDKALKRSM